MFSTPEQTPGKSVKQTIDQIKSVTVSLFGNAESNVINAEPTFSTVNPFVDKKKAWLSWGLLGLGWTINEIEQWLNDRRQNKKWKKLREDVEVLLREDYISQPKGDWYDLMSDQPRDTIHMKRMIKTFPFYAARQRHSRRTEKQPYAIGASRYRGRPTVSTKSSKHYKLIKSVTPTR